MFLKAMKKSDLKSNSFKKVLNGKKLPSSQNFQTTAVDESIISNTLHMIGNIYKASARMNA